MPADVDPLQANQEQLIVWACYKPPLPKWMMRWPAPIPQLLLFYIAHRSAEENGNYARNSANLSLSLANAFFNQLNVGVKEHSNMTLEPLCAAIEGLSAGGVGWAQANSDGPFNQTGGHGKYSPPIAFWALDPHGEYPTDMISHDVDNANNNNGFTFNSNDIVKGFFSGSRQIGQFLFAKNVLYQRPSFNPSKNFPPTPAEPIAAAYLLNKFPFTAKSVLLPQLCDPCETPEPSKQEQQGNGETNGS